MKKERLPYLDAVRGLAILLVVLGHIWETDQPIPVLIYSFHVPLFFIISGILSAYTDQAQRPAKRLILSRLLGLIVPYLFFEIIFLGIYGIRDHFAFRTWCAQIHDSLLLTPLNTPLWFLPTLFLSELFLILMLKTIHNKKCVALICFALYLIPLAPGCANLFPDILLRCLLAIGFLAAGYFSADLIRIKNPPWYLLLSSAMASAFLALQNGKTGIYKLTFHNPLLFTICALAGSYCTIFFLKKLSSDPCRTDSENSASGRKHLLPTLLTLAGRNSLTILGLHIIVLRVLQEILGLHTDSILGGLLALAGISILLTPVCWFLNRFFPVLAGKRFSNTRYTAKRSGGL